MSCLPIPCPSQEPEKPVIMAGMGTGLAPWRAVTQAARQRGGRIWEDAVPFGVQTHRTQGVVKTKINEWLTNGR